MTRTQILLFLVLSRGISAYGATITDFVIVDSSSFSPAGGTFPNDGGTFSGWFQADVSQIPTNGAGVRLTSWDIVTTGFGDCCTSLQTFNLEFASSNSSDTGFLTPSLPTSLSQLTGLQLDHVIFQTVKGNIGFKLTLTLIEPSGTFHGGLVYNATEQDDSTRATQSDTTGSAMVLDPAILSPEPGCGWLMAAGIGSFILAPPLEVTVE